MPQYYIIDVILFLSRCNYKRTFICQLRQRDRAIYVKNEQYLSNATHYNETEFELDDYILVIFLSYQNLNGVRLPHPSPHSMKYRPSWFVFNRFSLLFHLLSFFLFFPRSPESIFVLDDVVQWICCPFEGWVLLIIWLQLGRSSPS